MKMRLLITLVAATALSGCASYYDTAAGSAPGGYYVGRSPAASYGPYYNDYGYGGVSLGYGYGGYYGGYGYSRPYYGYGGYYPYHPYRPYHPRPDKPDTRPPGEGNRAPPWRRPDGRYQESGRVMIPSRHQAVPQESNAVGIGYPDRSQVTPSPRPMAPPSAPRMERMERSRPAERMERAEPRVRARTEEP